MGPGWRRGWVPLEWTAPGADLRGSAEAKAARGPGSWQGHPGTSGIGSRWTQGSAGLPSPQRSPRLSLGQLFLSGPIIPGWHCRSAASCRGWPCTQSWLTHGPEALPALLNSTPAPCGLLGPWPHPGLLAPLPSLCLSPDKAKAGWFSLQWTLGLSLWPTLSDWPVVVDICSPARPWASRQSHASHASHACCSL